MFKREINPTESKSYFQFGPRQTGKSTLISQENVPYPYKQFNNDGELGGLKSFIKDNPGIQTYVLGTAQSRRRLHDDITLE
jgi:hypothetical protein